MSLIALALPGVQQSDTVIPVRAGTRLEVENFGGSTTVRTWDKNAIRIVADGDERSRLEIRNLGTVLTVKSQSRYGPPRSVDYQVTVPVRTDLTIGGVYHDVTVEGVQSGISVQTVNGEIDVQGGDGFISLKSVEGEVRLANARGRITVSSVNEGVRVSNSSGDISAESVNGGVDLTGITSASVSATTVNGDVVYDGTIQDGGQYSLNTHNGDVAITVPEGASATVDVSTFNGEFETAFPVQLSRTSRNRFTFVLGSGSARLSLESFQGTIRLRRPGDVTDGKDKRKYRGRR
ncbi:MAG: DUF4097 family beta strand repeat protein [Gemmatimonadetes bacterium]|nr:DUF4097 family beta strand repeat protein [Gemmatimonadota bacterium]